MPLINLTGAKECAVGLDHPEGIAYGPDGALYAGGEAGQVYRVDWQTGAAAQYASTGSLNLGLALDAAANVYMCNPGDRAVKRITPIGVVSDYSRGNAQRAMINPNYPAFDAAGYLYVADSGAWKADNGCVWAIPPGGGEAVLIDTECSQFPNGCAVSPDGGWLYLAMSLNQPRVVRFPISAGRKTGPVEVVAYMPHTVPDGLAFCADGTLLVACYRPDTIFTVQPDGTLNVLMDDYEGTLLGAPTNVCFGGPDLSVLFWANLGRWHLGMHAATGLSRAAVNYPQLA
jgi:gluconolactonase